MATAGSLAIGSAAMAGPPLYVSSFPYAQSQDSCLKETREVLLKAKIPPEDITETTFTNDNGQKKQVGWDAHHPSENISASFECDARNGMGSMAVAGANGDATYAFYQTLWNLFFK